MARTFTRARSWVRGRIDRAGREAGQITLLSIAFVAIALLLVTAVISASSVHLERKHLLVLADDLALAAADSLDLDAFYGGRAVAPAAGAVVPLTDSGVRRSVVASLEALPSAASGLDGLQVESATSPDGRTARVTLSAVSRPALISWVTGPWSDGILLRVTSSARSW